MCLPSCAVFTLLLVSCRFGTISPSLCTDVPSLRLLRVEAPLCSPPYYCCCHHSQGSEATRTGWHKVQQGTQASYTRPAVSSALGARMAATSGATYVKTTSGSIITVVPKSLATLGGKIISSNIVSGTTTKITTIPMTSKPNVIVVQKTTGKGTTIQGIPGKNVVTTLLNAGGDKALQAMPAGTKPAIITATRPITKMIVTQPKGIGSAVQPATKIIPTKIVYGQQGKTQRCTHYSAASAVTVYIHDITYLVLILSSAPRPLTMQGNSTTAGEENHRQKETADDDSTHAG
ncbi:hypothetical protein GDO81_024734 [Engystomops pustulosus]|uniref:Uncharacterized protein n=1 Tax=Engystomops pustulosus TaxID=76066 RepID=A0AAV6ZMI7_ENGPU|nr:hypothetical protein GDO81_024734 [Engystomops pustulosus]